MYDIHPNYKSELQKWMSERYLTTSDVNDLIEEIRNDQNQRDASDSNGANWMFPSTGSSNLSDVDDSMDGDFDSATASAGHGTDEDYGGGCYQMEDFGWAGDENLCGE